MTERPEIESLVRRLASRHDGFLFRKIALTALLVASSAAIAISLMWVLRGHAVPGVVFIAVSAIAVIAAVSFGLWKRMTTHAAVRFTDEFFGLKDGITSARHLASHAPDEPATALQWQWLAPRLAACNVEEISQPFPKRQAVIAAALAAIAIALGLLPPSPVVRAAEELASETRSRIEESKQELVEFIKELENETFDPEEKEVLKLDDFRQMVKKLDESGDRAEVARQLARIEQKIRDAAVALEQTRDEETLKLAAAELAKAEETQARQLGKKLSDKELKEAAEMLKKLAAKKHDAKDLKADPEKLNQAKQDLAKMRAASKRLAAAGKQRQAARQAAAAGQGAQNQALEDAMAEMDDAAAAAEQDLERIELDPDAEFLAGDALDRANAAIGKLDKNLRRMHGKRMAKSKLDALRQALCQAQSYTQCQSQSLGLGGQKPGSGSSWSERKERDHSQENGSLTQLQGQHGSGPSLSSVEDAESGTGVSNRPGDAKRRDFARQTESFVQRDDVPESLKLGVRNYFENLQSATKQPD